MEVPKFSLKKIFFLNFRISLVVQGLRTHLPMQGTKRSISGGEDSTCCRATKSMSRNY